MIYEKALADGREAYSFWMAMLMRDICSVIREKGCLESISKSFYSQAIEITPTYYEDVYYCALLELYTAFGNFSVKSNNDYY